MTAQSPDVVINEHPRVRFELLKLFFIITGEVRGQHQRFALPTLPQVPPGADQCSGLWRGYIATFRLTSEGRLKLISYSFPYAKPRIPNQAVENGELTGDFWLIMRQFFSGPNTYVPFRDGHIIESKSEWIFDDQTLTGTVRSVYKNSGLILDSTELGHCYMPRSLMPSGDSMNLNEMIGKTIHFEIQEFDEVRRNIIVRPISLKSASE